MTSYNARLVSIPGYKIVANQVKEIPVSKITASLKYIFKVK